MTKIAKYKRIYFSQITGNKVEQLSSLKEFLVKSTESKVNLTHLLVQISEGKPGTISVLSTLIFEEHQLKLVSLSTPWLVPEVQ